VTDFYGAAKFIIAEMFVAEAPVMIADIYFVHLNYKKVKTAGLKNF
jgi:hypothetical protein